MSSVVNAQNAIECLNISDDDQFQEVSPGRSAAPSAYLKKGSSEMENLRNVFFQPDLFLGNVIAQFQAKTGKSVNYPCFLHSYFEIVPSEVWPCKKEIMESISHRLPKSFAARRRAKQEFDEWHFVFISPYFSFRYEQTP